MKWVAILLCIHEALRSNLGAEPAIVRRFEGYLSPSRQMSRKHFELGHDNFLPQPSQLIIH
jgi:hypothetical protein